MPKKRPSVWPPRKGHVVLVKESAHGPMNIPRRPPTALLFPPRAVCFEKIFHAAPILLRIRLFQRQQFREFRGSPDHELFHFVVSDSGKLWPFQKLRVLARMQFLKISVAKSRTDDCICFFADGVWPFHNALQHIKRRRVCKAREKGESEIAVSNGRRDSMPPVANQLVYCCSAQSDTVEP